MPCLASFINTQTILKGECNVPPLLDAMAFKKGKSTLVTDQGIFCCLQLLRMRSENPALLLVE